MKYKRLLIGILSFSLIVSTFALTAKHYSDVTSTSAKADGKIVIIDAGHPELVRHYRFSDLPPNINSQKIIVGNIYLIFKYSC